MLFMDSANLLAGPANLDVLPGTYAALMLRISGSTGAAAPVIADFGLITGANPQSRPWCAVTLSDLVQINSMELGFVENAIGALGGNPITISCLFLASQSGDGNVFSFNEDDHPQMRITLGGLGAGNIASGTIHLLGFPQEGVQSYIPELYSFTPNIAASTTYVETLKRENIVKLFVITTTNLANMAVTRDGEEIINAEIAELQAASNMDHRLEAAFTAGFGCNIARSGALTETLTDTIKLTLLSNAGGAATPSIVTRSLDYTPNELSRSISLGASKAASKIERKRVAGKSRPVTVADTLNRSR